VPARSRQGSRCVAIQRRTAWAATGSCAATCLKHSSWDARSSSVIQCNTCRVGREVCGEQVHYINYINSCHTILEKKRV
jgi:hypothetical protein